VLVLAGCRYSARVLLLLKGPSIYRACRLATRRHRKNSPLLEEDGWIFNWYGERFISEEPIPCLQDWLRSFQQSRLLCSEGVFGFVPRGCMNSSGLNFNLVVSNV
jgi:hypothetical protein